MIDLFRSEDDHRIGQISEEALEFLIAHLEEEDSEDTDYYIDRDTLEFLRDQNPPQGLVDILESALDGRDGIEVYYQAQEVP
ncbi:MAG TPA: galactosyldiacylglycerol synthase [Armatimonadota bacterium]|mgnify:FL=1|jgi:hypothetical protein|nr:galactosyldiacylglycerol synthase [Armatimonadota bacterium]HOJ20227.1 galactosyldiacylglycerol synthase [Armatimonadota bacterium]HOM81014.1 galactosyldiacylglycerol synthase [Armatimonadota bacterium]HPO72661.1 galactosyldiacylglycerol synthase [Armatimonadota bacterium]HPT96788.1 galactosyldiacylglycerol synthase [Armatimonadota bacterium]